MDDPRRERLCWNFINGYCRFGPRCIFRHEYPVLPTHQICRYFQKGSCWFGDRCKYAHIILPETDAARRGSVPMVSSRMVVPVPPSRRGSEPSYVQTGVRVGQDGNSETLREIFTYSLCLQEPSSFERSEEDAGTSPQAGSSSAAAATFNAQSEDEVQRPFLLSNTIICGICMELVYEKLDPKSHVFGILPNCNHPFCLQCIKTWRKSKDFAPDVVKTCPQCRVNSPFYVPNKYWVEGPEKQKVIAVFKEKVGYVSFSRPCPPMLCDCLFTFFEWDETEM
uniref:RING-type E3 ubiquitin transferase n=1 Tax=Gouania willdenowi TaxID=441366 RepID=A0A8C5H5S7_GOUWI